jgi:putative phage-type endonuclease
MLTESNLEERSSGIGGSDAAAVCGLDTYRQKLDVYLDKAEGIRDESVAAKECVQIGSEIEDTIARLWTQRNGVVLRRDNRTLRHPDLPWMIAHIDRRVLHSKQGWEGKNRGEYARQEYGPSGTDQVKLSDIMQCQHYMAVTGWGIWRMGVLIGGNELRSYNIPRDEGLIDDLIAVESEFWTRVQYKDPPPIDYTHRSTKDLLAKLYPGTNGEKIILDERAIDIKEELDDLSTIRRNADKRIDELKLEIEDMIGEAAVGLLPCGGGWTRKLVQRKGYEVKETSYYMTRFSKKLG